jgi:SAM-dependent methyltransferase
MGESSILRARRDKLCAVADQSLLIPMVEATYPAGREYGGVFHQAKRCPCCAYVRFDEPTPEDLDRFYNDEYPKSSASWYNVETDYAPWKAEARSSRVVEIMSAFGFGQGATVHEFGCAFGGTVQALKDKGYLASGTELNRTAVQQGRARGNLDVHSESALDYLARQSKKAQVIYSYHALEHFTDPFAFLRDLREKMDPNGIVISFLPNSAALFPLVYGHCRYMWFGYPEHVHLFSPGAADSLASVTGFELLDLFTNEFGIEPEATSRALQQETEGAQFLRQGPRDRYGEELVIVMTPAGGGLLEKLQQRHLMAREYSKEQAVREKFAMECLSIVTANPWPS